MSLNDDGFNPPIRRWYVPSGARVTHLFTTRKNSKSARSLCGYWAMNGPTLRDRGTKEPTRPECKSCRKELEALGSRMFTRK